MWIRRLFRPWADDRLAPKVQRAVLRSVQPTSQWSPPNETNTAVAYDRDERLYDLALGPQDPHFRPRHDEWLDPYAWIDLLLSAPAQVRANLRAALSVDNA